MDLKEELQEFPEAELLRIKDHFERLSVGSMIAIGRIGDIAACISDTSRNHPGIAAQKILHAPKTASRKNCALVR
jgi:hypothetical protein